MIFRLDKKLRKIEPEKVSAVLFLSVCLCWVRGSFSKKVSPLNLSKRCLAFFNSVNVILFSATHVL